MKVSISLSIRNISRARDFSEATALAKSVRTKIYPHTLTNILMPFLVLHEDCLSRHDTSMSLMCASDHACDCLEHLLLLRAFLRFISGHGEVYQNRELRSTEATVRRCSSK